MKKSILQTNKRIARLCRIGLCAALIAVCSQISIPLSVAVTLQTFAICTVCGTFGAKTGILSTVTYIALGAIGLPVFSGFRGGLAVLGDVGGGYIWGFVLTAAAVGFTVDFFGRKLHTLLISMTLGVLLCYACGTLWYYLVYADGTSLGAVLSVCVLPFILPDFIKIILAATVANKLYKHVSTL